jgi:hypothetical protein
MNKFLVSVTVAVLVAAGYIEILGMLARTISR